ncbi:MAG: ribosomal protein methyltransferase [Sphingomonadales bacterium]|jgi:ribosomal protein L11 methyltransferase|nr:ribosomal protein methyltransferase [Sphingomonadales bacterium]MEA3044005.1 ribosomal protein methyltransferase [Sphingomonadales bacterium]MEA3046540.1 ribosomal protein methyltransferase [Sphingomonadales bacterium]
MSDSWKVTLFCTKAEAEALKDDVSAFALMDAPPVLMTSEADGDAWRMDAYFEDKPDRAEIGLLLSLVPSARDARPKAERLGDADWVTLSQQGLEPIRAGRFFVHTPAHRDAVPPGAIAFEIDAGRAFGTGQHETTTGCLIALDRLKAAGGRVADFADIGTGTGLLAFAALRLWPAARAIASDNDPVAIEVAADNAGANGVALGRGRGRLELALAAGMDHRRLRERSPYDLVIANILAGPLIDLAPSLAGALAPGGRLILAGLLDHQAAAVSMAYRRQGMMPAARVERGDWPTLVFRKRARWR